MSLSSGLISYDRIGYTYYLLNSLSKKSSARRRALNKLRLLFSKGYEVLKSIPIEEAKIRRLNRYVLIQIWTTLYLVKEEGDGLVLLQLPCIANSIDEITEGDVEKLIGTRILDVTIRVLKEFESRGEAINWLKSVLDEEVERSPYTAGGLYNPYRHYWDFTVGRRDVNREELAKRILAKLLSSERLREVKVGNCRVKLVGIRLSGFYSFPNSYLLLRGQSATVTCSRNTGVYKVHKPCLIVLE